MSSGFRVLGAESRLRIGPRPKLSQRQRKWQEQIELERQKREAKKAAREQAKAIRDARPIATVRKTSLLDRAASLFRRDTV
jgi:hypothetical protein